LIRNPVPWPNGAKCAACFTLDMDAESLLYLAHPQQAHTMVSAASMLRYGPDVAVPRILDTYRHFGIRQTFFVPGWCAERYPYAVEAMVREGHEVSAHGYMHEHPNEQSDADEKHWLLRSLAAVQADFLGSFEVGGGEKYFVPRFTFQGPNSSDPIRIGVFAAIHGDEPAGALRAYREAVRIGAAASRNRAPAGAPTSRKRGNYIPPALWASC